MVANSVCVTYATVLRESPDSSVGTTCTAIMSIDLGRARANPGDRLVDKKPSPLE
ncbi:MULTISPECIES: hypothetical protein [unclassified Microcoleus]|uniref:hypothetical protein n=1 Tax=unclassified Microcoleus TaxID=2642155 RepID=UPI001E004E87|nr:MULTISPECIES: hypothetical protein [unclassified Microcoleus]MCC3443027.1 hypothetical protein [Microcoleus sp. PH2017_03_ELD_O_A]MCC3465740.1 hypothetical protein [Microcoleus sp. PH2017_06_SFM_O_A]MCC3503129.1 hypothetical protein [Microcoleus sp. PH2017_19_SFW_U_A]MCC3510050.1 hypothetical protein [Microcoleus sp. PH2017_17_BER_D_A]MCC3522096.1 hypothetical protein [Microcoleus sp. PH2017_20_SFW_D_A]MCC3546782.1 hypothetical protein [Microcoleus sp. PH2017_24_DOB_U_A]MCC3565639.1 hypot